MKNPADPNSKTIQLSLFDLMISKNQDDHEYHEPPNKPYPLLVAERWGFNLSYVDVDGDPKNYLYHILQWTYGLGASDRETWKRLKKQLHAPNSHFVIKELPHVGANGKTILAEFTNHAGCYAIAQVMRVTKRRPQLKEIVTYLRKAGVIFDDLRRGDPETTEWFKARLEGVKVRKSATEIYTETHIIKNPNIGALTNTTYQVLFDTRKQETAKKELVKILGLTVAQAAHFRDHLHTLALVAIHSAETLAAEKMRLTGRLLTDDEQLAIVAHAAQMEAVSYMKKCEWLGIDHITGEKIVRLTHYDYER